MEQIKAKIGVIGGSGLYDSGLFTPEETLKISTPYGAPSSNVEIGKIENVRVAFLARHGKGHVIPAHKVNYRANIWALKSVGVERIYSIQTVGSLKMEMEPGHLVVPDQFIDFTKKRDYSFYDGGRTYHISMADPFCGELRKLLWSTAEKLGIKVHQAGTYVCIEGPRFSTRAESKMFKNFADIIGMTLVPEAQLARELEICYASLCQITDYDVWAEKPVDAHEIISTMQKNIASIKKILSVCVPATPEQRSCECKNALEFAGV
ncbi:MAG: S-methyl-5'-thioadenosine phosphorylase [Thermoplasmata archaeon]